MNFKKTAKSFNMHFGRECEEICFSGISMPIIKGRDASLCASLSAGGCIAVARRVDGRFTAEFDDSPKYVTANVSELIYHRGEPILAFLDKIRTHGTALGGADVLFEYSTGIYGDYEPLLLSATYLFCPKTVPPAQLKKCLSNPLRDFASMAGRRETMLYTQGERHIYLKFSDSIAKIVLCHINEKNKLKDAESVAISAAAQSLSAGDYAQFGKSVTEEYARLIKAGGAGRRTKSLFETAVNLKDALGCGVLEKGGIFAITENNKVNAFVQNLKREYENHCGASPDFYVTRTENSGINFVIRKKDL